MLTVRFVWVCFAVCGVDALTADVVRADARPRARVALASPQGRYVLGEPVPVTVTVTNVSHTVLKVWVDLLKKQQIEILIASAEGNYKFREFDWGLHEIYKIIPQSEALQPGHSKKYEFRLLCTFLRPGSPKNRLAFDQAGRYLMKARYRLGGGEKLLESNTLQIRLDSPEAGDVEVWRAIDEPEYWYFLQSGVDLHRDRHVPLALVNILRTVPKSNYHPALRWALRQYYDRRSRAMTRQELETDDDMRQIRDVLGIKLKPDGPFPDDGRLDVLVTYHFPALTPLEDVFKEISKQSPVPIRLARELRIRRLKSIKQTKTLRAFMDSSDEHRAKWIRAKDGYLLVPAAGP